jgi:hypothetical protein
VKVVTKAADVAEALCAVIEKNKLFTVIGGRKHVRVEGWTLLGSMLGVFPVCVWTRKLANGWEARVEARTLQGVVVGAAEAECLDSEGNWEKRDDYSLRSMAQTRATAKALRLPLGFVVALKGYDATPAEEMPQQARPPVRQPAPRGQTAPPAAPVPPASVPTPGVAPEGSLISEPQRKRLYAIYKQAGKTDLEVKEYLYGEFGIEHSNMIPKALYEEVCAWATDPANNMEPGSAG